MERVTEERIADPKGSLRAILVTPYTGDPRQIDVKAFAAAAAMEHSPLRTKTGLVGSKDRVVQAAESVVSYVTPGDLSPLRSPGRSTLYRALTPGGGGSSRGPRGGGKLGATIGRGAAELMRCPTGYSNGGRFSDRFLSNCGQQLFDVPGAQAIEPSAARTIGAAARAATSIGAQGARLRRAGLISSTRGPGLNATIVRMAQVPRVGAASPKKVSASLGASITAAASARGDFIHLIRRDGVALHATVGIEKLVAQRKNVDMQGASVVTRIGDPTNIGHREVGLFSSGVTAIHFVSPGGHQFHLTLNGPASPMTGRTIERQWGTIRRAAKPDDGMLSLQKLAERSGGKLSYSETFNGIEKPNEMVRIQRNDETKIVPRWMYLAYYADSAPGRTEKAQAWKEVGAIAQSNDGPVVAVAPTASAALRDVTDGKPLDGIPASLLDQAMKKSSTVTSVDLGGGRTLVTRKNGEQYVRVATSPKVALSEQVLADFQRAVGVDAPKVFVGSSGDSRAVYAQSVATTIPDSNLAPERALADARPQDVVRVALVDFLFGGTNRNPASLGVVSTGKGSRIVPSPGGVTLPGASNGVAAIVRKPDEALTSRGGGAWARSIIASPDQVTKQSVAKMYDALIEDATSFDWTSYATRLKIDGHLSPAEEAHLKVLESLVKSQITQLKAGRAAVLRIFGAGSAA